MNNTKDEIIKAMNLDYVRILKMSNNGQAYLNKIKKEQ